MTPPDFKACSCDSIRQSVFRQAAMDNKEAIQNAPTNGAAAGIVFRITHPEKTNEDGSDKRRCNTCIFHIREAIVEMGLRPPEDKKTRFAITAPEPKISSSCDNCDGACKAPSFDYSPL